jgi:hypothetical protein
MEDKQSFPTPETGSNPTQQAPNVSKGQKKSISMAWLAVSVETATSKETVNCILKV